MTIRPILDPINTQQLENVNYNFGFLFNYVRALSGGDDIQALLDRINSAIANGEALNTQSQELIDELMPLLSELNDAIAEVGNLSYIGVWDGVTTYEKLNIVSYNGESYIAKRNNTNITPVEGDDWGTISQRGQQGIQGIQGEPGQGLIILGLLPDTAALPPTAQPGDAYLVQGTPFNILYVWVGSEFVDMGPFGSSSGLVKATQAQAIAGTDNDTYMTPLRVNNVTGILSALQTTNKTNLVSSINEVKDEIVQHSEQDVKHGIFTIDGKRYQGQFLPDSDLTGLKFVYNEVTD